MVDDPSPEGGVRITTAEGRGIGCSRYSRATLSYRERNAGYLPQKA